MDNQNTNIMEKKFRVISIESAYMFNKGMQALVEVKLLRADYNINNGKSVQTWRFANTDQAATTSYTPATETEQEKFVGKLYKTTEDFENDKAMAIGDMFYGTEDERGMCQYVSRNVNKDETGAYIWVYEKGEAVKWYFRDNIDVISTDYTGEYSKWSADEDIPESYYSAEEVYKYNDYRFIDADGKEKVHEGVLKRLFLEPDQKVLAEKLQSVIDECKEAGMCIYWSNAGYDLNAVNVRHVERIAFYPEYDELLEDAHYFDDSRCSYVFKNVTDYNSEDSEVKFVIKKKQEVTV